MENGNVFDKDRLWTVDTVGHIISSYSGEYLLNLNTMAHD